MMGVTHLTSGIAAGLLACSLEHCPPDQLSWAALMLGSLAPDIDTPHSTIARPGSLFGNIFPKPVRDGLNLFVSTVSRGINLLFGHRTVFHWPIVGAILIAGAFYSGIPVLMWLGIGYLTHLLGDALTAEGIPFLGPVSEKRYSLCSIRTGGLGESAVLLALVVYIVWATQGLS